MSTLVNTILEGLEMADPQGEGFGLEHMQAVQLANAAPDLLHAAKLAINVLAVQYEDGKGTVNADKALHAFGCLREAIEKSEGGRMRK